MEQTSNSTDITAKAINRAHPDSNRSFTPKALEDYLAAADWVTSFGLTGGQIHQLISYMEILIDTNRQMNLTAITDVKGIAEKHIHDSLTALAPLDLELERHDSIKVADIGTGAGLPGIVLKIMRPEIRIDLIDSLAKRVRFLEGVCASLHLEKVRCLHTRAEDAGRDVDLRETFHFVTARAVADLRVLAEYCLPLVREGGVFLAMKGKLGNELDTAQIAIQKLGGEVEQVTELSLAGLEAERSLITIRKIKPTGKNYPRQAVKIRNKPL